MNIAGFNEARLAAQYATFGEPAVIGGLSCVVCAASVEASASVASGGIEVDVERVCRVRVSEVPTGPAHGTKATIGGIPFRIVRVTTIPHAGEYLLGLARAK